MAENPDKPFDPRPMLRSFKQTHGPEWRFYFREEYVKYGEPEDWKPEEHMGVSYDPRPRLRSFKLVHGPNWRSYFPDDYAKYGEPEDWKPEAVFTQEEAATPLDEKPVDAVSVAEAGRRLGIGRTLMKRVIHPETNDPPAIQFKRMGSRILIPVAAIEKYLNRPARLKKGKK